MIIILEMKFFCVSIVAKQDGCLIYTNNFEILKYNEIFFRF